MAGALSRDRSGVRSADCGRVVGTADDLIATGGEKRGSYAWRIIVRFNLYRSRSDGKKRERENGEWMGGNVTLSARETRRFANWKRARRLEATTCIGIVRQREK